MLDLNASDPIILVIEDDAILASALREKLTRFHFNVLESHDGEEGLHAALRERPDLILLDIIMPKMDGVTMLKNLRKNSSSWAKTVPVIFLTNLDSTNEGRMKEILEFEPSFYLVKSNIKLEDVVDKIRERLGIAVI